MPTRFIRHKVVDFLLYIALSLVLAAGLFFYAIAGWDTDALARWGGLMVNTAFLYGYILKRGRRFWRKAQFWTGIALALLLHLSFFIYLILSIEPWRLIWFVGMYLIEIPLVGLLCDWLLSDA